MNDDHLDDLIRQSCQAPEFPPSFQREVWQRIAARESASWRHSLARSVSEAIAWFTQPASAVATVAIMLIIGAGLGKITSGKDSESNSLAAYAASINPILSAHGAFEK